MTQTIEERLLACNNRPSGFDYMRIVLASMVVWQHTVNITMGEQAVASLWTGPLRPFLAMILGMFFGLSGFLVSGSLERCRTMISFIGLRIIRLVPALAVDTIISALIIGPIFTVVPLKIYALSPDFFTYFLNIIGDIHFTLPGLFQNHPVKSVNGQLWTLPYELKCYASLTLLALFGIARFRILFVSITSAAIIFFFVKDYTNPLAVAHYTLSGRALVLSFLLGVSVYLYRDKIVISRVRFGLALALCYILLSFGESLDYLALFPMIYITVGLGVTTLRRWKLISTGDYSYGIFLYGFPIQQVIFALLGPRPWANLLLSYPLVIVLAAFSWFCVERPSLKLRGRLLVLEARLVELGMGIPLGRWLVQPALGQPLRPSPARDQN